MRRLLIPLLILCTGCKAVERASVAPLPDDAAPLPFADVVSRARHQAMNANEAFYVDNWLALEECARGIEQSANFLRRSTGVPTVRQADLGSRCDSLVREAENLKLAAQKKDVQQTNAILQRIHYQVRELRS